MINSDLTVSAQEGNHGVVKESSMKTLSQYSESVKMTKCFSYAVLKSQINMAQILKTW